MVSKPLSWSITDHDTHKNIWICNLAHFCRRMNLDYSKVMQMVAKGRAINSNKVRFEEFTIERIFTDNIDALITEMKKQKNIARNERLENAQSERSKNLANLAEEKQKLQSRLKEIDKSEMRVKQLIEMQVVPAPIRRPVIRKVKQQLQEVR